jgi:hypothetical protein
MMPYWQVIPERGHQYLIWATHLLKNSFLDRVIEHKKFGFLKFFFLVENLGETLC